MFTKEHFNRLIVLASDWAEAQEEWILLNGVPLNETELRDAIKIGVKKPEKVRLVNISEIKGPESSELYEAVQMLDFISPSTVGLSLRYGIQIKSDHWRERNLVVHELVHTMQYERLGGFKEFLNQYLQECIDFGYFFAPLEMEANRIQKEICSNDFEF